MARAVEQILAGFDVEGLVVVTGRVRDTGQGQETPATASGMVGRREELARAGQAPASPREHTAGAVQVSEPVIQIRDADTARIAIQSALTGHLVFSTLHTVNAVETLNRIMDFFEPHQQVQIRKHHDPDQKRQRARPPTGHLPLQYKSSYDQDFCLSLAMKNSYCYIISHEKAVKQAHAGLEWVSSTVFNRLNNLQENNYGCKL